MKMKIVGVIVVLVFNCTVIFGQNGLNPIYGDGVDISFQNQHWMFDYIEDTLTGNWSFIQSLPQALYAVNSYYNVSNQKVFICGGNTQTAVPQSACYWYDPASDSYTPAASLPEGRWSGKLVRVKDSLYLVGSIDSSFSTADGLIYKYSLNENTWVLKDTMPLPFVHESAVAVINDSLILTVGGSTNGLLGPTNIVRVYDPLRDRWSYGSPYPVNVTTAHAEYNGSNLDTSVYVLGGYAAGNLQMMFIGDIEMYSGLTDTLFITWNLFSGLDPQPFGRGVYRVAGGRWNDFMLFGPAMNAGTSVNEVWGLNVGADTVWRRFMPNSIDTIGNISTYGVQSVNDSGYLYLFGGYKNPNVVNTAQKYSFYSPPPIGIVSTGGNIPMEYKLRQNYPNPFNPITNLGFQIPQSGIVSIKIYDISGREVAVLVNEELIAGVYKVEFNASHLASGVYFYMMRADNNLTGYGRGFTETKKMVLVK